MPGGRHEEEAKLNVSRITRSCPSVTKIYSKGGVELGSLGVRKEERMYMYLHKNV